MHRKRVNSLVIIATIEDQQAMGLYKIAINSNYDVYFLSVDKLGVDWTVEINNANVCVTYLKSIYFNVQDKNICWYLRSPYLGSKAFLQIINLLHKFLTIHAYPHHNYFYSGDNETQADSKPLHANIFPNLFPQSNIVSRIRNLKKIKNKSIVKSISNIRSEVVKLSDRRLNIQQSEKLDCPILIQSIIQGESLKAHCYLSRKGYWHIFCVKVNNHEIDYRYDSAATYQVIDTPPIIFLYADKCYTIFKCIFFDLDFIVSSSNEHYFLEINFSPAPIYFEKIVWNKYMKYSSYLLSDWLTF
jgi:hypothetical protein